MALGTRSRSENTAGLEKVNDELKGLLTSFLSTATTENLAELSKEKLIELQSWT